MNNLVILMAPFTKTKPLNLKKGMRFVNTGDDMISKVSFYSPKILIVLKKLIFANRCADLRNSHGQSPKEISSYWFDTKCRKYTNVSI